MATRKLVDEEELARRLGVNRRTIANLRRAGRIPAIRINRSNVRYDPLAVLTALKGDANVEAN